ncbi:uroporphyrinogen-III C-methyltransferase [Promicromonospora iranensis]|uniref:uroporphyrinogen-III C-methyltransferase n=1 Tax=Promicromonospora iranensis TaxID=1105144 RepID=A0ABU2CNS0_9MICO|nr:uroporphyrinogen-III C-methyltransferase [Promicromonospora iranensis]MDR7382936.1 uroporphyrin-III C-methyltransferase/precorrin-2 dehydrogenase/sirohydrochlorin ferrochelatase [Promicromonospora iranensis]
MTAASTKGRVTLVGGGPGAVDLLTVRAWRALQSADVVVADRLGPVEILAELPPHVRVVDVGKEPGRHPVPQESINELLVEHALTGAHVVRLKGGDPFVLGRGGEEVIACVAAGVPVEVVPGVTSAVAVPGLAGIPLTHRGVTTGFHVVSGHCAAGSDGAADRPEPLDAAAVACVRDATATLVVLMGVRSLGAIVAQSLAAGADPATPVAIVENGSTAEQRVTRARLDEAAGVAAVRGVRSPAVVVIGRVAAEGLLVGTVEGTSERRLAGAGV